MNEKRQHQLNHLRDSFPSWDWAIEDTDPELFVGVKNGYLFEIMPPDSALQEFQDRWQIRFGRHFPFVTVFCADTVEDLVTHVQKMVFQWGVIAPLLMEDI